MADNSGMIKIALFAGAGYLVYKQGWLSKLGIGTPAAATPAAAPGTPTGTAPTAPSVNALDAIYTRMVALAKAPAEGYNADQWNYFLGHAAPDILEGKQPDPGAVGFTSGKLMPAVEYWALMAPYLKAKMGLSGLGIYGTLGCLACAQRGTWRCTG